MLLPTSAVLPVSAWFPSMVFTGIRNCPYSFVYCQLRKTSNIIVNRQVFYKLNDILKEVGRKVDNATVKNERIDYLTFVSDEEPTIDINLGEEISISKNREAN
jgi:wyosine [tRNA(Phe)-imidazoG37] synthetase (radical SAM superfamily)